MSNPQISVIVAVYNAASTLPRTIASLQAQTFADFEVLLLDDGSTDDSPRIIDDISAADSRFHAFHKANEGVGTTRRRGMELAQGDYVVHVDPDDWIEPEMFAEMHAKALATDADMVICDFIEERGSKSVVRREEPTATDSASLLAEMMTRLHGGCSNKLLRLAFCRDHAINFIDGLNYGEDKLLVTRLVRAGARVAYVPRAFYHYDLNSSFSATGGLTKHHVLLREQSVQALKDYFPESEYQPLILPKEADAAFAAVKAGVYSAAEYRAHFSALANSRWADYSRCPSQVRLVVWTSFHIGYGAARFLMRVKIAFRRLKRRLGIIGRI